MNSTDKSGNAKSSARSKLIVGADEAGYGPNLGPCVVAASVWRVPETLTESGFLSALEGSFQAKPFSTDCGFVPLGDSKKLFRPKQGLETLETGLLASLNLLGKLPKTLRNFVARFSDGIDSKMPWYLDLDRYTLPFAAKASEIDRLRELAYHKLHPHAIQLCGVHAKILSATEFNDKLRRLGSKGELLSLETLGLVRQVLEEGSEQYAEPELVEIFCDRQGGRKNYLPVLFDVFPERWFREQQAESSRCSYQCPDANWTLHFSIGGDSFPPTALASMLAKYLRECLMYSFNAYWQTHILDLKRTAGYPADAQRFRLEIQEKAAELGLDPMDWWRRK